MLIYLCLVVALLSGCYEPPDKFVYDCKFIKTCGERGYFSREEFYDTPENIEAIAQGWSQACQILTQPEVEDGHCDFVFCGALCAPRGNDEGQ